MSSASKPKSVDKVLLTIVVVLVATGFLIFSSASLGLLARDGASFGSVAFSQFVFGIIGGGIALFVTSNIYYRNWRRFAFYIFGAALLLTTAVFIPGIGMSHGGATRWLNLGFTSVQPSEFLKIGFVIYLATWFSGLHKKIDDWRYGLVPFLGSVGIVGVIMLAQPDTDTFLIMAAAGMAMFIAAGARMQHVGGIIAAGIIGILIIALFRPYVMDRLTTFLDPEADPLGSGYQIQQSLIAIGSGGVVGRGFGQSIQKFEYLPEPIGDSIFAVYAEEFGFLGTSLLVIALVSLALRGYKTAAQADDIFGTLLVTGFITVIIAQAFLNIAAMTGMAPLSGLPLPFISHGGTALMANLAALGIVLNVSKYRTFKKSRDTLFLHMKIAFVGGASGGHFYPLIAVAEVLHAEAPDAELYYFGPSPYKKQLLADYNIHYIYCPAGKLRRYFSVQNFLDIFRSFFGVFVALLKLYVIYPDVIFSKGSYTSVPILLAARFLRIPVVMHESDSKPGRASKVAKGFAKYIGIAYDDVAPFFPKEKTALVGIPLRKEILTLHNDPFSVLGIPGDKPFIYVTGGSQGAEKINSIIVRSLTELLPTYRVFHQVGDANMKELSLAAKTLLADSPYLSDYYIVGSVPGATVAALLDAASVVVTRAGSTTLFEIAFHGKPAVVIPIPEEVSHDQRSNAFAYARNGAAVVIEEKNLTTSLLTSEIHSILSDPGRFSAMSAAAKAAALPGAAEKVATLLQTIAKEHE